MKRAHGASYWTHRRFRPGLRPVVRSIVAGLAAASAAVAIGGVAVPRAAAQPANPWELDVPELTAIVVEHAAERDGPTTNSIIPVCMALTRATDPSAGGTWKADRTAEKVTVTADSDVARGADPTFRPDCSLVGDIVVSLSPAIPAPIVDDVSGKRRLDPAYVRVPAGRYHLTIEVWDPHVDAWERSGSVWRPQLSERQPNERVRLLGLSGDNVVWESPATTDLADDEQSSIEGSVWVEEALPPRPSSASADIEAPAAPIVAVPTSAAPVPAASPPTPATPTPVAAAPVEPAPPVVAISPVTTRVVVAEPTTPATTVVVTRVAEGSTDDLRIIVPAERNDLPRVPPPTVAAPQARVFVPEASFTAVTAARTAPRSAATGRSVGLPVSAAAGLGVATGLALIGLTTLVARSVD